jgi:hypothetical protein
LGFGKKKGGLGLEEIGRRSIVRNHNGRRAIVKNEFVLYSSRSI